MGRDVRCVTTTKRSDKRRTASEHLSVIIPTAGCGHRMKSYGPKPLLKLANNEYLLQRQINIVRQLYPHADIIVVVGFEADRITPLFPGIRFVENENYETTGVSRSISLGLKASIHSQCLLIYGNLLFDAPSIELNNFNESYVFVRRTKNNDVGVTIHNSYATNFAYDMEPKWNKTIFLQGRELELFAKNIHDRNKAKMLGHEILNNVLNLGASFKIIETNAKFPIEIHSYKDLAEQ